ncbi:uncharacterized protein LOC119393091 [Rhipicephalus sanguineus]|uniref:uncharacterized protein LOC119393091 n=1 Tax=Rhipicephalus sanguineus TaxID=34632 RepID=UPI0020C57507|nr:uncharacterized protein LOC119393091 [Rhipicephalus sanguineus]
MGCAALKVPCGARRRRTGPTVDLVVGSAVRAAVASLSEKRLILVFGGPGSRKGQIVNDLANCFGFEMVSAEKLILAYFARHLHLHEETSGPVGSTQSVEEMLKGDENLVSLWLLLELLGQELDSRWRPGIVFLADPVPNLRYMLPSKRQMRRCQRDMQLFEKQWPCLFALSLCVPESRLCPPASRSRAPKLGDEKDIAKTKKRYQEYTETVHELLQYFRDANRLVAADVPHDASLVSEELVKFLDSLGFVPRCTLDPNVVFLPVAKGKRRHSRSSAIIHGSPKQGAGSLAGSPALLQSSFYSVAVNRAEPQDCKCLGIIHAANKEGQQGLLERPMRLANQPNRRFYTVCWEKPADDGDRKERKVLFSGVEKLVGDKATRSVGTALGETYLFPEDTDWNACRQVALLCSKHLHWQCTDQRNGADANQPFSSDT